MFLLYSIPQLSSVVCPCLCNSLIEYELGDSDAHKHLMSGITQKGYTGDRELEDLHYSRTPNRERMNDSANQRCIFRSESKQKVTLLTPQGPSTYVQLLKKAACSVANTVARRKELCYAWDTIRNARNWPKAVYI